MSERDSYWSSFETTRSMIESEYRNKIYDKLSAAYNELFRENKSQEFIEGFLKASEATIGHTAFRKDNINQDKLF
jgi:2-phosphoglycerate kinase